MLVHTTCMLLLLCAYSIIYTSYVPVRVYTPHKICWWTYFASFCSAHEVWSVLRLVACSKSSQHTQKTQQFFSTYIVLMLCECAHHAVTRACSFLWLYKMHQCNRTQDTHKRCPPTAWKLYLCCIIRFSVHISCVMPHIVSCVCYDVPWQHHHSDISHHKTQHNIQNASCQRSLACTTLAHMHIQYHACVRERRRKKWTSKHKTMRSKE